MKTALTFCFSVIIIGYIQGQCIHNGIEYAEGEQFQRECNKCFCGRNGLAGCDRRGCLPNSPGMCEYEGKKYYNGERFKADCNTCTCMDGVSACTEMACVEPLPPATCRGSDGQEYGEGEGFKIDCNACTCSNGIPLCTLIACNIQGSCVQGNDCNNANFDSINLDGTPVCCQNSNFQLNINSAGENQYRCACDARITNLETQEETNEVD